VREGHSELSLLICEIGMNLLNCLITHRTSSDYAPACCVVLSTRNGFAACAGVLVLHYCAFVDFMSEPLPYTHLHAYIWVIYVMGVLASLVVKLISLLQCVSWLKPSLTVVFWLMHTVVENKGTSFQWPWKAGSGVDPAWFSSVFWALLYLWFSWNYMYTVSRKKRCHWFFLL